MGIAILGSSGALPGKMNYVLKKLFFFILGHVMYVKVKFLGARNRGGKSLIFFSILLDPAFYQEVHQIPKFYFNSKDSKLILVIFK